MTPWKPRLFPWVLRKRKKDAGKSSDKRDKQHKTKAEKSEKKSKKKEKGNKEHKKASVEGALWQSRCGMW